MIKFKQGWIGSIDGKQHDIVVKSAAPNTLRDALIGGGTVLVGIIYLTYTAFKNGAKEFENAEFEAMREAGVIDCEPDETCNG